MTVPRSDLTPGKYPMVRTRGDTMRAETFTLALNESPWNVDSAVAQVRVAQSSGAALVVDLAADVSGADVTVGDGVELDVDPGTYWWDLEVTDSDGPLTIVGGSFVVLDDVSEVVVP